MSVAVSAALYRQSLPAVAFRRVASEDRALLSAQMRSELLDVFSRSKFDRWMSLESRRLFLADYFAFAIHVIPSVRVEDCVDPKDNMILECALAGDADIILTGDDHLLRLHPWCGIAILQPAQYLALEPANDLP